MKIYTDVLSQEVLHECCKELSAKTSQNVWGSSTATWHDDIKSHCCGIVNYTDVPYNLALKLNDALYGQYFSPYKPATEIIYQFYIWNKLSSINVHDDKKYSFGATLYLNNWKVDWGGLFVWKDKDEKKDYFHKALCPKKNMLVVNDNNESHTVTSISPYAPDCRFSIQIWGVVPESQ